MKKLSKLIAVVAAMALLMGMSTSAFAAGSPEDPTPATEVGSATVEGVGAVDLVNDGLAAEKVMTPAQMQNKVEEVLGVTPKANEEIVIVAQWELTAQQGGVTVNVTGNTVHATLAVPGAKAGDTVYVLHLKDDGTWEGFTCTVAADGTITVDFTGLSPVYLAMIQQKADADTANKDGKSPKTGF